MAKSAYCNFESEYCSYIGSRYALQLSDTILIGQDKSTLLTEGTKLTRDTLFFLNDEDEAETKKERKPLVPPRANGSPVKKTAGTKVLRNQSRRAAQDEVHQTAATRLIEHQKELRDKLQEEGLRRFSEEGSGIGAREGKTWKKFQSFKGEAALPPDVDKLRVSFILSCLGQYLKNRHRSTLIGRFRQSFFLYTVLLCLYT